MPAYFAPKISRIFFRPLAEMAPVVPKWAEFGQNQKYQKNRKTELGKVTKFQKATLNGLGVTRTPPPVRYVHCRCVGTDTHVMDSMFKNVDSVVI